MPQAKTWLKTDLSKPITVYSLENEMFTLDNQGNQIGVEVYDGGEPVTLTGTIIGYIIRADGDTVYVEGSISTNKATIVLPAAAYAVVGQITIVIRCINGEQKTVLAACKAHVTRSRTDEIIDPGTVIPSVEDLPVVITSTKTYYQTSNDGTQVPTGTWSETIPTVDPGDYLWQKEVFHWNDGQDTIIYTHTRFGVDGSGSVDTIEMNGTNYQPDANGKVNLGTVVTDVTGKLDKNQGSNNSGKYMKVGNDGNLSPVVVSSAVSVTAAAGSWSSANPPTQTISATGVTASNLIFVALDATATAEQISAFNDGQIRCTAQAAGEITLTCFGSEPTINLPFTVAIVG